MTLHLSRGRWPQGQPSRGKAGERPLPGHCQQGDPVEHPLYPGPPHSLPGAHPRTALPKLPERPVTLSVAKPQGRSSHKKDSAFLRGFSSRFLHGRLLHGSILTPVDDSSYFSSLCGKIKTRPFAKLFSFPPSMCLGHPAQG